MSKLYQKYLDLKSENSNKMYLFKSGIFYLFLDKDAYEISKSFGLKLTNLNDDVKKCGFPANNLSKYVNLLNEHQIEFCIVDENLDKVNALQKYLDNQSIVSCLKKIQKSDIDNMTPKQAYDLIYELNIALAESEI